MKPTKQQLAKLSPEEREFYLAHKAQIEEAPIDPDEDETIGDVEEGGDWGTDIADLALSLGNDYLLDFGDEIAATLLASALVVADGDSEHWKKYYRMAQKTISARVERGRGRHPISTLVSSFLSPSVISSFLKVKKLPTAIKQIEKLDLSTKTVLKTVINKTVRELGRTGIESGLATLGRKKGGDTIKNDMMDALLGGAIGSTIHLGFKGTGGLMEWTVLGKKAQASANKIGAYFTQLGKYVEKARRAGETTTEAVTDLMHKMFDKKLLTHTNIDYDVNTGEFIQRVGQRIKQPNMSDIERNTRNAIKVAGTKINEILKTAGAGDVGIGGVIAQDIAKIKKAVTAHIESKYTGDDRIKALKVIEDLDIRALDLAKRPGKSSPELLNDLRKELDNKVKKIFGAVDTETNFSKDITKKVVGEIRGAIKDKVKDPKAKEQLERLLSDSEDFYTVLPAIKSKSEHQITSGREMEVKAPTKWAMGAGVFSALRDKAAIGYHQAKEAPAGTTDFIIPPKLNAMAQDIRKGKFPGSHPEHGMGLPSAESLAQIPTRAGREGAKFFQPPQAGETYTQFPEGAGEEEFRVPQQEGMMPGMEQVDQMAGQAEQMNRVQMQQEKRQKEMLDKLRMAKLPRNSDEFAANKELVMAKFTQDAPVELANVSHILAFEPDKIEDMMTLYSQQFPNLFVNDQYKRINGKIIDNVAKNRARKETFDREDIPTSQKAEIIDKINKTGMFTADIDTANANQAMRPSTGASSINDIMAKLKSGQATQPPAQAPTVPPTAAIPEGKEATGTITTKTPEGKVIQTTPTETLDVF